MTVDLYQFGVWQGSVAFQDGQLTADPSTDPVLKQHIDELQAGEIRPYQDYRIGNDQVMVATPMRRDDPNYPLGFCQMLERAGYDVVQRHPEVDEEIRRLASQLPNRQAASEKLDSLLPTMTHLEKTYVRDALRIASSHTGSAPDVG